MALGAYSDPTNALSGAPSWAWNRDRLTDAVTAPRNQILGPAAAAGPTWADAYTWNRQNLADTVAAMRDPQTWVDAARLYGNALMMGTEAPGSGIRAFHGSPYDFERFSKGQIGTGEGAQAYGHGLYFAENPSVAQSYRPKGGDPDVVKPSADVMAKYQEQWDALVKQVRAARGPDGRPTDASMAIQNKMDALHAHMVDETIANDPSLLNPGKTYEVNIQADPEHMLDWDKTVGQHPDAVRDKLLDMGYGDAQRGRDVYMHLSRGGNDVAASQALQDAGIPGIRYLDQGSRGKGEGTSNYVVFNDAVIDILRKYGIAGLIAGGGAAAAAGGRKDDSGS